MVVIVTINWQQRVVTQTLSSKVNLKNGENSKNTAKRYRRWARKETTVQVAIIRLKKRKAILKTLFTLTKHQLTHLLGGDELSSWDKIHEVRANLFDQQQVAIDIWWCFQINMNFKTTNRFVLWRNRNHKQGIQRCDGASKWTHIRVKGGAKGVPWVLHPINQAREASWLTRNL